MNCFQNCGSGEGEISGMMREKYTRFIVFVQKDFRSEEIGIYF